MSADVLLIMPKIDEGKDFHHFPFGCLALAASLEKLGIEYDIFDERVDAADLAIAKLPGYRVVGVSMFTGYQTTRGVHWLRTIRTLNPDAITIVGGPHVTALPQQTAQSDLVDYAIAGYGENSFANLVSNILQARDSDRARLLNTPGVYADRAGNAVGWPTPKKYNDIGWAPLPYHRIDVASYLNPETRRVMYVSQYGCPALCTFCATPETRKWTSKPLELVYQDLELLDALSTFRQLCFFDATLFTNRARTMQLIQHLDDRFPGRQWLADARAAELIRYSDEDFQKIKRCRADLKMLVVGLESGSEYIAEKIVKKGKGHLKNFYEIAKRTHAAGIAMTSGVVFGFPGESANDLKMTNDYIAEIRKIHPGFRISTTFFKPLPGTELYDQVTANGYMRANSLEEWADFGGGNHYNYNEWNDVPWMSSAAQKEYLAEYRRFMDVHGEIVT